ncbi:MAG TPA: hypothetical protein PLG47_06095, partial [Candidatus Dojkabacteria bacterium]|nr:hypothetical protein [Candidatus Dojkabacteria bacterium]
PTTFAENLINDIRFLQKGATYLIVDALNGKVAIPIDRDRAGEDVAKIVTRAVEAYLDNDVAFRDEILKITGDDITDPIGLRTFINRYVHVVNTGKNSLNNLITKGVFKTGSKNRYLTVLSNGTVEVYDGTVTGRVRFTSPTNQKQRKLLVDSIRKSLPSFYLNTNIKALSENSTLPFLDSEGKIVQRDYKDYLLETTTTDVKGNEIGDSKYAYMIQPVYRFDFSEFTNPIKEKPTTPTESTPTKPEVSEEEFKKMLSAFEEFDLPYVGQVKPGVQELFESNPELSNIGTQQQYSQYLDTIFPDSKVKDILWHSSSNANIEKFDFQYFGTNSDKGMFGVATYLEANRKDSIPYNRSGKGRTYGVIVNIQNPAKFNEITDYISLDESNESIQNKKDLLHKNNDSAILGNWQYAIFNNDNTHILGSKQD